jgi:hypothetical protein
MLHEMMDSSNALPFYSISEAQRGSLTSLIRSILPRSLQWKA